MGSCDRLIIMATEISSAEYMRLNKLQKVKKIFWKILPILVFSVILPTADIGSDLYMIHNLFRGFKVCSNKTEAITEKLLRDEELSNECQAVGAETFCISRNISERSVCGSGEVYCVKKPSKCSIEEIVEFSDVKDCQKEREQFSVCESNPGSYCTPERVYDGRFCNVTPHDTQ